MNDAPRGVARWTDPAWREPHLAWVADQLADRGRSIVGEPEQRARPWGTVFRVATDDGRIVWSKANGPGPAHEGAVLDLLVGRGETSVVVPLAMDRPRAWLLLDDAGPTMRVATTPDGRPLDADLKAWVRVLPTYAALQRRLEGSAAALVTLGVPDERPSRYPELLAAMVADEAIWARVDDQDQTASAAAREQLAAASEQVTALASTLETGPVAASLDHGDLHGNNIVIGPDGAPRWFDWGDAVVAHPFATMTSTLGSIAYHTGRDAYGPELDDVRTAYLGGWADVASPARLADDLVLAMDLGHIGKAAAWERALHGLEPDQMAGHHGATAAWLRDLADRLAVRQRG